MAASERASPHHGAHVERDLDAAGQRGDNRADRAPALGNRQSLVWPQKGAPARVKLKRVISRPCLSSAAEIDSYDRARSALPKVPKPICSAVASSVSVDADRGGGAVRNRRPPPLRAIYTVDAHRGSAGARLTVLGRFSSRVRRRTLAPDQDGMVVVPARRGASPLWRRRHGYRPPAPSRPRRPASRPISSNRRRSAVLARPRSSSDSGGRPARGASPAAGEAAPAGSLFVNRLGRAQLPAASGHRAASRRGGAGAAGSRSHHLPPRPGTAPAPACRPRSASVPCAASITVFRSCAARSPAEVAPAPLACTADCANAAVRAIPLMS